MRQRIKGSLFFVGDLVRSGDFIGLDSNKAFLVVTTSDVVNLGLDKHSLHCIRDNGWIPIKNILTGEPTCLSKTMIHKI